MTTKDNGLRLLASGRWQARFPDAEGTLKTAGTYKTKTEAKQARALAVAEVLKGTYRDPRRGKKLFRDYAEEVMAIKKPDLRPGTYRNYVTLLNRQLLPTFGDRAIADITINDVDRWWAEHADHLQNRKNGYNVLAHIMRRAVRSGLIITSPCQVEEPNKEVAKRRPEFTVEDFEDVLEQAPPEFQIMLLVTFAAHLRLGELCGLNYGDYKPAAGVLSVVRQASHVGGFRLAPTKTGNWKNVKLLQVGRDALNDYVSEHPSMPFMPMFTGDKGGRVGRSYVRREWLRATEKAGLPEMHFHDLRHIGLTLIAQSRASQADLMARGGHSSNAAAMKYQHSSQERDYELVADADRRMARHRKLS